MCLQYSAGMCQEVSMTLTFLWSGSSQEATTSNTPPFTDYLTTRRAKRNTTEAIRIANIRSQNTVRHCIGITQTATVWSEYSKGFGESAGAQFVPRRVIIHWGRRPEVCSQTFFDPAKFLLLFFFNTGVVNHCRTPMTGTVSKYHQNMCSNDNDTV